jgi:thiaminase (transcriptional activator TenA)
VAGGGIRPAPRTSPRTSPRSDRFTDELWAGAADIYAAILAHPFLAGLTDGSLPEDAFAYYVVQDAIYLRGYAQALAAAGSRAPDARGIEMFSRHAAWISTYGGDDYGAVVRQVIEVIEAMAAGLAPAERALVHQHFRTTSRYEWMFWDMGYRRQGWPV